MEVDLFVEALDEAPTRYGKQEAFYSDQGSKFT